MTKPLLQLITLATAAQALAQTPAAEQTPLIETPAGAAADAPRRPADLICMDALQ